MLSDVEESLTNKIVEMRSAGVPVTSSITLNQAQALYMDLYKLNSSD